jgi:hypothetical protein
LDDVGDERLIDQYFRRWSANGWLYMSIALIQPAWGAANIERIEANPNPLALYSSLAADSASSDEARAAARVLENCLFFTGPNDKAHWLKLFGPELNVQKPQSITSRALADLGYSRCAPLMKMGDISKLHADWMQRAANKGDLIAKLVLRQRETPTEKNIAAFESELRLALNSKDPDTIWEAGRALMMAGFSWQHVSQKPWGLARNGKAVDGLRALFQAASCELGYPCGPKSWVVRSACIRGSCGQHYVDWLATFLSETQMQSLHAELPRVVAALKAGRGDELIWKDASRQP